MVAEVQTVTTSAIDRDEAQTLNLVADNLEAQLLRVNVDYEPSIQKIQFKS